MEHSIEEFLYGRVNHFNSNATLKRPVMLTEPVKRSEIDKWRPELRIATRPGIGTSLYVTGCARRSKVDQTFDTSQAIISHRLDINKKKKKRKITALPLLF